MAFVVTGDAPPDGTARDVVVPIDLVTQRAGRPIALHGHGVTHAVVVMHDGRTVLAAIGTTIVPVSVLSGAVGTPLELGSGKTVFGMALSPTSSMLYVLVPGGVIPVNTATATAGLLIPTGLTVSSVSSPHGLLVSADGATVYVAGQDAAAFGGRLVPINAATGAVGAASSFDQFGIADPTAIALTTDGARILAADGANNWIVPVPVVPPGVPSAPVRLPTGHLAGVAGTDHPSDIEVGPGATGAFVVTGLDTVLPFAPNGGAFGQPIRVCSGASSMAVAGA